jgi:CDP-glucose 4,6-dehydratase
MGPLSMKEALQSYRGKKVFITGHTGFKGTWFTFLLKEVGAEVMGYSLPPEEGANHFDMLNLKDKIKHVVGDIRDREHLTKSLVSFQPEYVFHLAAQALVKKSYNDPAGTFDINVMGSVNLLEAVKACDSVKSLVYITSDKCYENVEWVWGYRENDRLGGHDPYSASKAAAEIVFSAYARSFLDARTDLGAATTRAGNVIGGGDWALDRIIPDCIRAIESNKPIQLRNPKATRPWQHVLEPLSGYLLLGALLRDNPKKYAGSWNFGPPSSEVRTVYEVANSITAHLGKGTVEITGLQNQHHEAQLLQLSCDKAHQYLNWYPRWNVAKTLEMTSLWFKKAYFEKENVESITRAQLQDYFPEIL